MVLKLQHALELPGALVKTQIAEPYPSFWFSGSGVGLKMCISYWLQVVMMLFVWKPHVGHTIQMADKLAYHGRDSGNPHGLYPIGFTFCSFSVQILFSGSCWSDSILSSTSMAGCFCLKCTSDYFPNWHFSKMSSLHKLYLKTPSCLSLQLLILLYQDAFFHNL